MKPFTLDELKATQDNLLEMAKSIIMKKGKVLPLAFVVTRTMNIDKYTRDRCLDQNLDPVPEELMANTPRDLQTLVLPLSLETEAMLGCIKYLFLDSEKADRWITALVEVGRSMHHPNPEEYVVKAFQAAHKIPSRKDLLAHFLYVFCKRCEAQAIIKVEEAWFVRGVPNGTKRENLPKDLKDHPNSLEAIHCTMEAPKYLRMLVLEFTRENGKKGEGKISAFAKVSENVDDFSEKSDISLVGRFIGLLPQNNELLKERQRPDVAP